ncbi:hypothetical protein ZTR_00008 [Talaromyces verruculosus]|nr:hypothetical protein ZTR_00008 [Talaromyces verruculosus]
MLSKTIVAALLATSVVALPAKTARDTVTTPDFILNPEPIDEQNRPDAPEDETPDLDKRFYIYHRPPTNAESIVKRDPNSLVKFYIPDDAQDESADLDKRFYIYHRPPIPDEESVEKRDETVAKRDLEPEWLLNSQSIIIPVKEGFTIPPYYKHSFQRTAGRPRLSNLFIFFSFENLTTIFKMAQKNTSSNFLLLGTFSILILLVTIDIYLSVLSPANCSLFSNHSSTSISSDYKGPQGDKQELQNAIVGLSQKGTNGIVFREVEDLKDMGVAGDQKWDDLFAGDGYLFLKPENSSLPQEPWGVSMFHELHCLQVLRNKIQGLEAQVSGSEPLQNQGQHGHHHDDSDDSDVSDIHYLHCFSYLAQSIACSADDTLEPPHINHFKNGSFRSYNIDGIGTWHQCRDQSLVRRKMIESKESMLERWDYKVGDTVQSVWG